MVEDLDAAMKFYTEQLGFSVHAEFLASGAITADVEVINQPYSSRELYVRDPFGYQIGFSQTVL